MKTISEKKRKWLWFIILWCAGLVSFLALALLARLILSQFRG